MRRSLKHMSQIAAAAAIALLLAAISHADITVSATFAGLGQGNGGTNGSIQTTGSFDGGASESDTNGGEFLWQNNVFTDTSNNSHPTGLLQAYPNPVYTTGALTTPFPNNVNDFITFCIQLNQNVSFPYSGPYSYTLSSNVAGDAIPGSTNPPDDSTGMGAQAAALLSQAWWQHITSHYAPNGSFISVPANLPAGSQAYALDNSTDAGAFQLLVWKLVYDGSTPQALTPGAGNIILPASPTVGSDAYVAEQWLSQLSTSYSGPVASLVALESGSSNGNYQDQIGETQYNPNLTTAPEPASLLVWGGIVGLATGFGRRTRRLKK